MFSVYPPLALLDAFKLVGGRSDVCLYFGKVFRQLSTCVLEETRRRLVAFIYRVFPAALLTEPFELEAGFDQLAVPTTTAEFIGLTTCNDPVNEDEKRSLGCKDGFFSSSSSFSRILLSASNNLSGEFMIIS